MEQERKSFLNVCFRYGMMAREGTDQSERRVLAAQSEVIRLISVAFRQSGATGRLAELLRMDLPEQRAATIATELRRNPENFGPLRGGSLSPAERQQAEEAVRHLAEEVGIRADERVISQRYEELYVRAKDAERGQGLDYSATLGRLELDLQFCNATRDARLKIADDLRQARGRGNSRTPSTGRPSDE